MTVTILGRHTKQLILPYARRGYSHYRACIHEAAKKKKIYIYIYNYIIQWNPSITATIGEQHDGRYTGVAVVEWFCVLNVQMSILNTYGA